MGVFHVFLRKASYIKKLFETRLDSVFLAVETRNSIQICGRQPLKISNEMACVSSYIKFTCCVFKWYVSNILWQCGDEKFNSFKSSVEFDLETSPSICTLNQVTGLRTIPFVPSASFLYPLKTSERVHWERMSYRMQHWTETS